MVNAMVMVGVTSHQYNGHPPLIKIFFILSNEPGNYTIPTDSIIFHHTIHSLCMYMFISAIT